MAGVAPKDGERGGILSEAGGGEGVPSSPTTSFVNDHYAIGDGGGPEVPTSLLHKVSSTDELIEFVFPDEILAQPQQCLKRAILCATDSQIDSYNTRILQRLRGDTRTCFAADSLVEAEDAGLLPSQSILDYVAQRTPPGLPPHSLRIHVGGIYRFIRDFSPYQGLAKDCRVVITSVGQRIIAVKTLQTENTPYDTEDILIPRVKFNAVLFSGHTLLRLQFPLAPAYATTTDSCRGLTLDAVGIDLTKHAFSHGQLYTAISRVRHRRDARVLLDADENTTTNVTF